MHFVVGSLNVESYCFKFIGSIKSDGGGGKDRLTIVIHSVQNKRLAVSEGGDLSGAGLTGGITVQGTGCTAFTCIFVFFTGFFKNPIFIIS